ncbi:MAG: hypothetical protein K5846_08575 [Bacteroidales bacterium]|nr:hypothetical protein [Bacteroidales bacterium]
MKKLFLIAFFGITAMLATSCLPLKSLSSNQNVNQTQVILSQANFKVVGIARGEAKGNTDTKILVQNAYSKMIENANLTGSQALVNINYERRDKHNRCTHVIVTATIIEFTK